MTWLVTPASPLWPATLACSLSVHARGHSYLRAFALAASTSSWKYTSSTSKHGWFLFVIRGSAQMPPLSNDVPRLKSLCIPVPNFMSCIAMTTIGYYVFACSFFLFIMFLPRLRCKLLEGRGLSYTMIISPEPRALTLVGS